MSIYTYVRGSRAARLRVRVNPGKIVGYDHCPVPRALAVVLDDARHHGSHFDVISCDRRKGVAEKFGKLSQWALWDRWRRGVPGYLPANPPGRSTHEKRSDGHVYKGPPGRRIKWWGTGIDLASNEQAHRLVKDLAALGYSAWQPYNSGAELHHLNFRRNPMPILKRRGLA